LHPFFYKTRQFKISSSDLSDSDDDATWTPFKEKGANSGGIGGTDMGQMGGLVHHSKHKRLAPSDDDDDDDLDDDDDDDDQFLIKRTKKFSQTSTSNTTSNVAATTAPMTTPSITSLVPEGQDFKTGDFVVLREDIERESAPIWR
jgi:hypothetical protein